MSGPVSFLTRLIADSLKWTVVIGMTLGIYFLALWMRQRPGESYADVLEGEFGVWKVFAGLLLFFATVTVWRWASGGYRKPKQGFETSHKDPLTHDIDSR